MVHTKEWIDQLYQEHRELFGNRKEPGSSFINKDFGCQRLAQCTGTPDDTYAMEHEGELENWGWYGLRLMKDLRLSMDTMPSQKKNSASKSKIKLGCLVNKGSRQRFLRAKWGLHARHWFWNFDSETQQSSTPPTGLRFWPQRCSRKLAELHLENRLDVLNIEKACQ